MLKKLPIIAISLAILWGYAEARLISPASNQLEGAVNSFVLKTASVTTKTVWGHDTETRNLASSENHNVADNVVLDSTVYRRDTISKPLSPILKAVHNRLNAGGIKFVEQGDSIKYLSKDGDEIARIQDGAFTVSKERGKIPDPGTYLDTSYINNHIKRFKQEGAGFIVVKSWIEGGNPIFISLPLRKFVGVRSEMDTIIFKYKTNCNDWTILRDELNLGAGTNLTNEEIFYIKISGDDSRFSFDIPNGNESGAIVGEWVPGGYTKSGIAEAALVGSENIVHKKTISQLLDYFTNNWEKIR